MTIDFDFDADPLMLNGWCIHPEDQLASRPTSIWELDPCKIGLHLDSSQQDGKSIKGSNLKERFDGQRVLPAHILDWLLEHTEKIPESWKKKEVFFWGTIYRDGEGSLFVRLLRWRDSQWSWSLRWLTFRWTTFHPAAVLGS